MRKIIQQIAVLGCIAVMSSCTVLFESAALDGGSNPPESDARNSTDGSRSTPTIFAGAEDDLWSIDPMTLEATSIGVFSGFIEEPPFSCGGLALGSDGTLYAITVGPPSRLYTVDTETAVLSNPIDLSNTDPTWASTVVPAGMLGDTEKLMLSGPAGALLAIELSNGNTTKVGSFGGGWGVSGDLAWVDGVGLMATVDNGGNDMLATISLTDGSATINGDTGRGNVYALTSVNGRVWGLTGSNEIFEMRPSDASELSSVMSQTNWSTAAP